MQYILYNHVIDTDVEDILNDVREATDNFYLKDIRRKGRDVSITCPFHKFGQENRPSCYVYNKDDADDFPFGYFKCFTCGEKGPLHKLVAKCLDISYEDAKEYLIDRYSSVFAERTFNLPEIKLNQKKEYLDESILEQYMYIHPYILKRGISPEVVKKFKVGWNKQNNSITFPVWDEHGGLVGITERYINRKYFYIPEGVEKPVYLLNYIKREGIDNVYVCESQINALTLQSFGYPAIALFGTGTKEQYEILKRSGIRIFRLALDGDLPGAHGMRRFIENMPDDVYIEVVDIPKGKDVNDLTKEEFDSLPRISRNDFMK